MKKKKNKGFSLIELIIAIAILVILTGLLAPQFMRYMEKAREAKDMQALDTVFVSVKAAAADEKAYSAIVDAEGTYQKDTPKISVGIKLEEILDNDDAFAKELKANLGGGASSPEFISKAAKKATGASVWIIISDNMEVTVVYGTKADTPVENDDKSFKLEITNKVEDTTT